MDAIISFISYFVVALVLLVVFMFIYVKVTPYNEFAEISKDNVAAAITFGGAILGFTLPLAAAVFFTHDLLEMAKWAGITGLVQLVVFMVLRRFVPDIQAGNVAPAILLFSMSVAIGVLNAVCISN
jgi:putative membrane protein